MKKKNHEKEVLALIPARGGSKRIPRKNIRDLWGKPLLAYSIETALKAKMVNRVICTTDDKEIAEIALEYGAEVPFLRPKELAGDLASDTEYYLYTLSCLKKNEGYEPDIISNFRPTNPLRRPDIVDDVITLLISRPDVDSVRTVNVPPFHPYKFRILDEKTNLIKPLVYVPRVGPYNQAKQPLPKAYIVNAYLDATWVAVVLEKRLSLGEKMLAYVLEEDTIDIDTEEDWQRLINQYDSFEAYLKEP